MYYVYDERMVATTKSFSPSSRKPALVVADWEASGLRLKRHAFNPATRDELGLAHDPAYVDGVLSCEVQNGFHNQDPEVAASLPWTVGAMLSAARLAVKTQMTVCAPVSGFHHAHYDYGTGFCTFNVSVASAPS
jgi:acetoin utilization deacetylase AcuC-like enzyme